MGTKFIVVASGDNSKQGGVTVLDDVAETERFVEVLLRAGVEQERIQIYAGGEVHSQITQRPVVTLIAGELEASAVRQPRFSRHSTYTQHTAKNASPRSGESAAIRAAAASSVEQANTA